MPVGKLACMNTPRTTVPIAPRYRQRSQRRMEWLALAGGAVALIWLGAMISTLTDWLL